MTNLIAVLMAFSLPAAGFAQSYGAAEPSQQGEAGPGVEQPPVATQQQVTGSTINNFMPMRAPAAVQQEPQRASTPQPQAPKTSSPKTQQCANAGYEVISTKGGQRCAPKCASGETRDQSTGTCKKANQTPQMAPPAGGGGEDSSKGGSGADKGGALGQEKRELQEMPKDIQKGQCGAGGGLCGNTDREKKVADKYVQFQQALQPGDGMATPPSSPQSVQGLKGELGTLRSYQPRDLTQKAETARSKIEGAKAGFEAVQVDFSKQSAALAGSYTGIKLNETADFKGRPDKKEPTTKGAKPATPTDFKKQSQEVQAKIDALKSSLEDLKAKLGAMCGSSLETVQALKEAIEKSGTADDKMMEVYQKLQTENTTASPVENDFMGSYPQQFSQCDLMMETAAACKMQVMQTASTRKTGYNPQPTQQAAQEAVQSAKDAFSAMTAVEKKHQAALSKMREVVSSAQKVDAAAVALRNQVGGMNAQQASGDENLKKRIAAINSVYAATYKEIIPKLAQEARGKFIPGYRQVIDTARELDRLQTSGR